MVSLFHCTLRENLPSILKHGLLPHKPDEIPNALKGIYLSRSPFEWMYWATDKNKYAGVMIEVDVTDLKLKLNIGYTNKDEGIPEFICEKRIPVERFIRVSVSTDKHPTMFEEFDFKECIL